MNTEVFVIGGGPAGSAIALQLARLGHRVTLAERHRFPRPHIGESLPPSILPLLDQVGVRGAVEQAGFLRPASAIVRWSDRTPLWKESGQELGFQVDRGVFDDILLRAARAAGVRVLQPARVDEVTHLERGGWRLQVQNSKTSHRVHARFVVDASGRTSVLRGRCERLSSKTTALYAYWRHTGIEGPETRVDAGSDQWYWGAPLPDGSLNATVFVDPEHCAGLSRSRIGELYQQLLAESSLLRPCLQGELLSKVRACDATSYRALDPAGEDWIRVGEACSAIDPLSSQGVQTAIASALQGAVVTHTLLEKPDRASSAIAFYTERQGAAAGRHAWWAGHFYARQETYADRPFWRVRAVPREQLRQPKPRQPRRIPANGSLKVGIAGDASLVDTPVIRQNFVTRAKGVDHPALDGPIAYVLGLEIAPLLEHLPSDLTIDELSQRWSLQIEPRKVNRIIEWMWSHQILVPKVFQERVQISTTICSAIISLASR